MCRRKIYILHKYGDESHFLALYREAYKYGYDVEKIIILSKKDIIIQFLVDLRHLRVCDGIKSVITKLFNNLRVWKKNNEIMIVGIAPYDYLMNKYWKLFKKNISFYFTSHANWDGENFPRGRIENKQFFEHCLKNYFRGAFCVSKASCKELEKIMDNCILVNHSICYEEYKKEITVTNDSYKLIFVGAYTDNKNIKLILDWFARNTREDVTIDFLGRGPIGSKIDEASRIDERIANLGYVNKEELRQILCNYDYLILPSKIELFGIVIIEALASGTPCIVSNSIGPREIIFDGYNGYVFDLENEFYEFGIAMNKALSTSKEKLSTMRNNAMKEGMKYSTNEIIKRWISAIDRVVNDL